MGFVRGPDFPTGGVLKYTPYELYAREKGEVVVAARLELQTERDSERARYVASEFPWPLEPSAVVRGLEALAIDGIRSLSEDQGFVIIELEHVAYAWWVKVALEGSGLLHDKRFIELRVDVGGHALSCNLAQVLNHFLNHRVEIMRRRIGRELPRRKERAEVLEGLLITAEFSENVLDVLRDADDTAEARWGLMHLASSELKARVSFARHTPVDPTRLSEVVTGLMNRLLFDVPQRPAHSYAIGFSERQATAILTTRRLHALQRDALFREWLECCLEVAHLEEPQHGVKEAEVLVLAELEKLKERYARPRRTESR